MDSDQFHVFELTRQLPKFSMYSLVIYPEIEDIPKSFVKFRLVERVQRVRIYFQFTNCNYKALNLVTNFNLYFLAGFMAKSTFYCASKNSSKN